MGFCRDICLLQTFAFERFAGIPTKAAFAALRCASAAPGENRHEPLNPQYT